MKRVVAETDKKGSWVELQTGLGTWLQVEIQGNQLKPLHVEVVAQRGCRVPMDLGDTQYVTENALSILLWMTLLWAEAWAGWSPGCPSKLSCGCQLFSHSENNRSLWTWPQKWKITIHQSRKPPARSLFKFESELEAVFESYMNQFRPLIVFHQNTLMHQNTLIY